jgi:hypothetical protein
MKEPEKEKFRKLLVDQHIKDIELSRGRECDNLTLTLINKDGKQTRVNISVGAIFADMFIKQLRKKNEA